MSGIFDSLFFPVGDGGGGGSATVNGTLRSYQVNEGAEVEAGDFVEFVHKHGAGEYSGSTVSSAYADKLNDNMIAILYNKSTLCIIQFSGNSYEIADTYTFTQGSFASFVCMPNNKIFITYTINKTGVYGVLLTVDAEGSITETIAPTKFVTSAGTYNYLWLSCNYFDENTLLVTSYEDASSGCDRRDTTITISGGQFSASQFQLASGGKFACYQHPIIRVKQNTLMYYFNTTYYSDYVSTGGYKYGTYFECRLLTKNSETGEITAGSSTVYKGGSDYYTYDASYCCLDETNGYICIVSNSSYYSGGIYQVSGTSLNKKVSWSVDGKNKSVIPLDNYRVAVLSGSSSSTKTMQCYVFPTDYSSSPTTPGTVSLSNNFLSSTSYVYGVSLGNGSFIIFGTGSTGEFKGASFSETNGAFVYTNQNTNLGTFIRPVSSGGEIGGVAKTAGTAGQTIQVYCAT